MIELYDYQSDLIDNARDAMRQGHRRVVIQAPTGAGKTVIGSSIAKNVIERGGTLLIVAHRIELINQWRDSLTKVDLGDKIGLITADSKPDLSKPIQIGMVQTIARRRQLPASISMLLIDEAHHSVAGGYKKLIDRYNDRYILGVTATPARLDGKGLGEIFGSLICGPSTGDLIDQGRLAPYRYFVPEVQLETAMLKQTRGDYSKDSLIEFEHENRQILCASLVKEYQRLANDLRSLVFVQSVMQAHIVAEAFNTAGIKAVALSGDSDKNLRKSEIQKFANNEIQVVVSVDLFGEGTDLPAVEVAQLARPTMSLCVFLQQVGRVLRFQPNKTAIIIDHVNNVQKHGLPCEEREWSLEGKVKNKRKGKIVRKPDGEIEFEELPEIETVAQQRTVEIDTSKAKVARDASRRFEALHWDSELDRMAAFADRNQKHRAWLYFRMMDSYRERGVLPSMEHLKKLCEKCGYAPGKAWYAHKELKEFFTQTGSQFAPQGVGNPDSILKAM